MDDPSDERNEDRGEDERPTFIDTTAEEAPNAATIPTMQTGIVMAWALRDVQPS